MSSSLTKSITASVFAYDYQVAQNTADWFFGQLLLFPRHVFVHSDCEHQEFDGCHRTGMPDGCPDSEKRILHSQGTACPPAAVRFRFFFLPGFFSGILSVKVLVTALGLVVLNLH